MLHYEPKRIKETQKDLDRCLKVPNNILEANEKNEIRKKTQNIKVSKCTAGTYVEVMIGVGGTLKDSLNWWVDKTCPFEST